MKKFFFLLCFLAMTFVSWAQNTFPSSGNVGIGTTSPNATLHLNNSSNTASLMVESSIHSILGLVPGSDNSYSYINIGNGSSFGWQIGKDINSGGIGGANGFYIYEINTSSQGPRLVINKGGNIGIGTNSPTEKLAVNGKIRAKEINVETGWSDFVFEPHYKLLSLKEIEDFIKKNKHLPEIPSAKEVGKFGINVGEMNSKLLQKIEELTLYLIEQSKRSDKLEMFIEEQQKEINQLKSKL